MLRILSRSFVTVLLTGSVKVMTVQEGATCSLVGQHGSLLAAELGFHELGRRHLECGGEGLAELGFSLEGFARVRTQLESLDRSDQCKR